MVSVVSVVLCSLHRDVMVRHTPAVKTATMMHVMMMIGMETVVSSLLYTTMEGAIARGGAKVVELGLKDKGGCVLFTRTYPLDQELEFLLSQSLPPQECI